MFKVQVDAIATDTHDGTIDDHPKHDTLTDTETTVFLL